MSKNTRIKTLAKKMLRKYRLYRRFGYSPTKAKAHAHFVVLCLPGGKKNLFAENALRKWR